MSRESWYEDGRPIRGGVPVCWPWFGPHSSAPDLPSHGLARTRAWNVESIEQRSDGRIAVTFLLTSDEQTRQLWPYSFELRYDVVVGETLELTLRTRNPGKSQLTLSEALHSYFRVADVQRTYVEGLEHTRYIDKVDAASGLKEQGDEPIAFEGEVDRPYLDTPSAVTLVDPELARRIIVRKRNSRSTVVWNPHIDKAARMEDFADDEWPTMVCLETANVHDNAVTVDPGQSHEMTAEISVAELA
jgi:D-hexose-6-phosphate mutarotase